jgi:hypothetical protein
MQELRKSTRRTNIVPRQTTINFCGSSPGPAHWGKPDSNTSLGSKYIGKEEKGAFATFNKVACKKKRKRRRCFATTAQHFGTRKSRCHGHKAELLQRQWTRPFKGRRELYVTDKLGTADNRSDDEKTRAPSRNWPYAKTERGL